MAKKQSMKLILGIVSPHPDAYITPNVKPLDLIEILPTLSDYYQHLVGRGKGMSWTEKSWLKDWKCNNKG